MTEMMSNEEYEISDTQQSLADSLDESRGESIFADKMLDMGKANMSVAWTLRSYEFWNWYFDRSNNDTHE